MIAGIKLSRLVQTDFQLVRHSCKDLDFSVRLLARRLFPLYILVLGVVALCTVHFAGKVDPVLLFGPAFVLTVAILLRLIKWHVMATSVVTRRQAIQSVVSLHRTGPLIGLLITSWMMSIYWTGSRADQGLLHLLTASTGIISVLCLGATPFAAGAVAFSVLIPSSVIYLLHSHPNGNVIALVQATIFAAVMRVVYLYQSDLLLLTNSRKSIALREIKLRELAEEETRLAHTDALTGLRNRRAFLENLTSQLASGETVGLALVDLDGFKDINDSLGHLAGDRLLQELSGRLMRSYPEFSVGRLGGDEFAILFSTNLQSDLPDRQHLLRIVALLSEEIQFEGMIFGVGASLGFVQGQARTLSVKDFLERADHAMYRAKEQPGSSVVIYGESLDKELRDRHKLTAVLSHEEFEKHLDLAFQPIVDVNSDDAVGMEALSRWSSPGLEEIGASDFIRLAESSGKMTAVTRAVVSKAVKRCPTWETGASLFINISGHDLMRPGGMEALADLVVEAGAPPENIVFEITETAIVNVDTAVTILERFKSHGFRFALDDFGSGMSSLNRVHRLPIDVLKVDGGFADGLADDPRCRAAVGTVVELARQMRIDCVIEGIESQQQAHHATLLGGSLMQGYLFGRPMGSKAAVDFLEEAARAHLAAQRKALEHANWPRLGIAI